MDNWFASSEQLIKDNLAWFIVLAILLGAIWGVWSSVVREIERPSRYKNGFRNIKLTLTSEVFLEIKGIVFRLLFANTLWAILLSVIVAILFFILNRFYETVWVKLIIAFSVSHAIARKQGKISLLNAYLGGFDLDSVPFFGDIIQDLTKNYEDFHKKQFEQLNEKCNELYSELINKQMAKESLVASQNQEKFENLLKSKSIGEIENLLSERVAYWPQQDRQEILSHQLEQIRSLPESERNSRLIALVEQICPELINLQ
jgi:hypothetical protein